jgi:hypothetical protein
MNILVTVCYSSFNPLFEEIDRLSITTPYLLLNQITDGQYMPKKGSYFRYSDNKSNIIVMLILLVPM